MFFHLSINHYAQLLIRFWFGFGVGKKEAYVMESAMPFLRRHVVMLGLWNFVRDLPGSDGLHLGDGMIMINADRIWLDGKVAPGSDYCLYLTLKYVETGPGFQTIKAQSQQIRPIKVVENFSLDLPDGVDVTNYQGWFGVKLLANLSLRLNYNAGLLEK